MKKEMFCTDKKGLSIIEILLAISLFALLITGISGVYLYGQESALVSHNRSKALLIASETIEVARDIRHTDLANLTDGTYGLAKNNGMWEFVSSPDEIDIYTRQIEITSLDPNRKEITATVEWQQTPQRSGAVSLVSHFSNWQEPTTSICSNQASFFSYDTSTVTLGQGGRQLNNVLIQNTSDDCEIIVASTTISWDDTSKNITRVRYGNSNVWSGSSSSGVEVNIEDTPMSFGGAFVDTSYSFDGRMQNNVFSIDFVFSDGTSASIPNITPM